MQQPPQTPPETPAQPNEPAEPSQPAQPTGRVEQLPHPPVVEPVAQLDQLARVAVAGEHPQEAHYGRLPVACLGAGGGDVRGHGLGEVWARGRPGGGGRGPDGRQAAESPRASPAVAGCSGGAWSLA